MARKAKGGIYRRLHVRMWGDEKFRALSSAPPNAQTLWVYLLTGDQTGIIPGVFKAGQASLAEALGWQLDAFGEAYAEVERQGMVHADWKARVVFIPNAIKYNPPGSPNVVRAWANAIRDLPECELKTQAIQHIQRALGELEGKTQAFAHAFGEAMQQGNALRIQDQEQKQENIPPKKPRGKSQPKSELKDWFAKELQPLYPGHRRRKQIARALSALVEINPDAAKRQQILDSLEEWKRSPDWLKNKGQFIPGIGNFLFERYFEQPAATGNGSGSRAELPTPAEYFERQQP
jgi:hypothetical protein